MGGTQWPIDGVGGVLERSPLAEPAYRACWHTTDLSPVPIASLRLITEQPVHLFTCTGILIDHMGLQLAFMLDYEIADD